MMPPIVDRSVQTELWDDFIDFNSVATTGKWKVTKGTGGTLALASAVNGRLNIPTAASANDYVLLSPQSQTHQFLAKKPIWAECLINLTEAATNQANIVWGLSSILTTGFLVTGNAGLPTTWDGFVFYKVGATSVWQCAVSRGTTVSTIASFGAFATGVDTRLGFHFDPNDGVTGIITPFLNGQPLVSVTVPVTLKFALSGALALYPILGVVAGSSSAETLQVDYTRFVQAR